MSRANTLICLREISSTLALDTNGAGDMFAGVFLHGITHGKNYASSATVACKAASEIVSTYGARLSNEALSKAVEE